MQIPSVFFEPKIGCVGGRSFALLSWLHDIFHDKKNDTVAGIIQLPIGSMYGIFAYIWVFFMINVGR